MKEDKQKIKVMDNDFYREKTAAKKRMVAKIGVICNTKL